jgi:hypothetical protein
MKIWNRLDEVIGAGIVGSIAIIAMLIGYDSSISQMCVTGIIALLATSKIRKGEE